MRFLFLAVHAANRAPGQRFRFEQYLGALRGRGVTCDFSGLLDADGARVLYSPGKVRQKAWLALRALGKRLCQALTLDRYDLVFVQREALFIGGPFLELRAQAVGAKLVFDFDDAIWLGDTSEYNRRFAWLKRPDKVERVLAAADLVIAGNRHLADYARRFNAAVEIVPTTIDTDSYAPRSFSRDGPLCIGWSGSFSTIRDFRIALPMLGRIRERYGDRVRFKVIGDGSFRDPALGIVGLPWCAETEIEDLRDIDIGLMPLPDNEWARGKCGLKGLQYMGLGIPTLMSPVGVNAEIITDGSNGFLPRTDEQWEQCLCALIDDPALRVRMGAAGRRRVQEAYSVRAWTEKYCDLLVATAERSSSSQPARTSSLG